MTRSHLPSCPNKKKLINGAFSIIISYLLNETVSFIFVARVKYGWDIKINFYIFCTLLQRYLLSQYVLSGQILLHWKKMIF